MSKKYLAYVGYNMMYEKDYEVIGVSQLRERALAVALTMSEENDDAIDSLALGEDSQVWTDDDARVYGVVEVPDIDVEIFKEEA